MTDVFQDSAILIHTSVKLVTGRYRSSLARQKDFNPHEREARDMPRSRLTPSPSHFNPHEREARDFHDICVCRRFYDFNPHEREARDEGNIEALRDVMILIHTSVKLVTAKSANTYLNLTPILIHTSVKLVTDADRQLRRHQRILIHTSVKLVTSRGTASPAAFANFNPHEREARDFGQRFLLCQSSNFNPHEREARDAPMSAKRYAARYFNPHEREARDMET